MNDKLKKVLQEVFDLKEIDIHLTKEDITKWDSLAQMDLVTSLEREFDIILEIEDIVAISSIKSICEVLKSKGIKIDN
ncbi:MAG: acyl carrier protein [Deltaproteobacteria bacterium]|nr:acyl carrier protein [Deltaproteobacteria bacterium]